jgi:hypothetical protein
MFGIFVACNKDGDKLPPPDPCLGVTITIDGTTTPTSAPGSTNGSISVAATGGTGFTYSMDDGPFQASGTFNNLAAGTYKITAKNNKGCTGSKPFTITDGNPCSGVTISVTGTIKETTGPGTSTGSITVTASGGTGFTYSLNNGAFQGTGVFGNLPAGTYTVTAKSDKECKGTKTFVITDGNPCAGVTIVVAGTTKETTGPGTSTGSISATATGGAGFTYSLNNGAFQASGVFNNLPAGTYTVTAKSDKGCTGSKSFLVTDGNPCAGVTIAVNGTIKQTTGPATATGSITATATGGTGFTFSLNGGAFQASGVFNNLVAGTYTITAKSSTGCTGSKSFVVTNGDPCAGVTIAVNGTIKQTTGPGTSTGSITATATGGTGFSFSLNGGAFQASGVFNNLVAGTYTITAKSSAGCTGSKSFVVSNGDPCAGVTIAVNGTIKQTTGPGTATGSITATATGGTGFTFSLNGGAFQATGVFNNLTAGTYTITAKSSAGCTGSKSFVVTDGNPCAGVTIAVNGIIKQTTGPGTATGSITATATGGTGFTFSLNGGAFQASGVFNNLAAGTYTITAKSSAGCTGSKSFVVTNGDPCAGVTIAVNGIIKQTTGPGTATGSITATATGGTGFTFSLNGGAFQASGVFNNLVAGTYTVTAKSSAGCTGSKSFVVTNGDPCAGVTIVVNGTIKQTTGAGTATGSITATATGGTGFTFSLNGGAFQASGVFNNLPAGTYTVTAKSDKGCTGSKSFVVTNGDPCAGVTIVVNGTIKQTTGPGTATGSITATATGGTGFTFSLNGGAFQASGVFNNLTAGTYTITAKSSAGCTGSKSFVVTDGNPCAGVTIAVNGTIKQTTGPGTATGSITATATGGTGFTFSLNGGAFQASGVFNNLVAGTYTITAKSSAGCTGSKSFVVTDGDPCAVKNIVVTAMKVATDKCENSGTITVSATGSTGFTYKLNANGTYQSGNVFNQLPSGNYTVFARDATGCEKSTTIVVDIAPNGPFFTAVTNLINSRCVTCHGAQNAGGVDFRNECTIVSHSNRIKVRAVDEETMPRGGPPLTTAEKKIITDWISAGAKSRN